MCQLPGMHGNGGGLENLFRHVIEQLLCIDEREGDWAPLLDDLRQRGVFSSFGVYGKLNSFFAGVNEVSDELASIYGQLAYQLGYLQLDRVLSPFEWSALQQWFSSVPLTVDMRLQEVKQLFGEPSFHTLGNSHQVHCYAGADMSDGWFCFDYGNQSRHWTDESGQHFEWVYGDDFILRDRRRTAGPFIGMIEFTPFGQQLFETVGKH